MTFPRTAILLAAGCSRRLQQLTLDRPKCLLDIGGRTLVERQIGALRGAGVQRIVVVTGYHADKVEAVCGPEVTYVENPIYDRTNSLYSLSLAIDHGAQGFVLANADVLFHPDLLRRLLAAPQADALLYEPNVALGDEEMKVRIDGEGRVRAMAKTLERGAYHGENLGVLKFSAAGHRRLAPIVEAMIAAGDVNAWAPKAFDAMCGDHPIHAISSAGLPWIEIDFPEDLQRARDVVGPRIDAHRGGSAPRGPSRGAREESSPVAGG